MSAQPPESQRCPEGGLGITGFFENDTRAVAVLAQADADFTAAARATFAAPVPFRGASPGPLHAVFGRLNRSLRTSRIFRRVDGPFYYADEPLPDTDARLFLLHPWNTCYQESWAFGVNLYTPTDERSSVPVLDDRPYAAWAFAVYSFTAYDPRGRDIRMLDLYVGLVGPAVHGESIQNGMHQFFKVKYADGSPKIVNGWANQLKNEPTVNLNYLYRHQIGYTESQVKDSVFSADLNYRVGGAFGNVMTRAQAGITGRFGYNMTDLAPPGLTPITVPVDRPVNSPYSRPLILPWTNKLQAYVFTEHDAQFVLRNMFLDGNLFRPNYHTIRKKRYVVDDNVGIAIGYGPARFTWRIVSRTHEFEPLPPGKRDTQIFGSMTFTWFSGVRMSSQ